jgi:hypothetical protein
VLCWGDRAGFRRAKRERIPQGRNPGWGSRQSRAETSAGRGQAVRPSSAAVPDRDGAVEDDIASRCSNGLRLVGTQARTEEHRPDCASGDEVVIAGRVSESPRRPGPNRTVRPHPLWKGLLFTGGAS